MRREAGEDTMTSWPYMTKAQAEYDGPEDLRIFADILPAIGELAISFSRLERRVTWAIESLLGSSTEEADEMESLVRNFSSRLQFLGLIGRPVARETGSVDDFEAVLAGVTKANRFRNDALHNAFTGISGSYALSEAASSEPLADISVMKQRYHPKPEKRPYHIPVAELRAEARANLDRCSDIQRWVLSVRPSAENRVP
jgi:hypothetical protein